MNNRYAPYLHTGFANTYTKEKMDSFTKWVRDVGFAGFSMEGKSYPLTTDVEKWRETFMPGVRWAVEGAKENGIEAWLFDEWGFPTGTAGGLVMKKHPEFRSKRLHKYADVSLKAGQTISFDVPKNFLACSAWNVGRFVLGMPLANTPIVPVEPKDGKLTYTASVNYERLVIVTWEYESSHTTSVFVPDPTAIEQGTLDLISYEAVACFIENMHETYVPVLEGYFGDGFYGFFYDEPYINFPFPYTFDILDEFKEKKGYDLTPELPLMLGCQGTLHTDSKALRDYRDVVTDRFARAFFGQMLDWCHAHGVEMVGHQDLDHSVRGLSTLSGDFFRVSKYNDAPGVDYIWNQINGYDFCDFPRFAGSARRLYGKKYAMSEIFAAVGRSIYPDLMRFVMEFEMVRGVNRFYLMIADPDPVDEKFTGPMSRFHPQSIAFGRAINDRVAKTNEMLNTTAPAAHTAVLLPMGDIYCENMKIAHPSTTSLYPHVWDRVHALTEKMCYAGIDYEYLPDEAFATLPREGGAYLLPTGQKIDTVVVPGNVILDEPVRKALCDFADAGGKLISVKGIVRDFLGKAIVATDFDQLVDAIEKPIIVEKWGKVSATYRQAEDGLILFLLNEAYAEQDIIYTFKGEGHPVVYDRTGNVWRSYFENRVHQYFKPFEMKVVKFTTKPEVPARTIGATLEIPAWEMMLPQGGSVQLGSKPGDWREYIDPLYVGWVTYKSSFDWFEEGVARLDLGWVNYAAKVRIDDQEYTMGFSPFERDIELTRGAHTIEIDVLNTDVNKTLGTVEKELELPFHGYGGISFDHDRARLVSGLCGPVTISSLK